MRYRPIRRNSEFGRVYARGKSYVNPALVLYVLKTRGRNTRVGLTATKKIGHAVQRNRARRVPANKSRSPAREPAANALPQGAVRAHPHLPVYPQPMDRPQLPVFAQLQQLHHAGHPDPRLYQGHSAGRMAHCPVQSAGQVGIRPRAAARPLAKPRPQPAARKAV